MPRTSFLNKEEPEFSPPIRTSIAPEVKGKLIVVAGERTKAIDMKTHQPGRDKELERSVRKKGDMELLSKATDGGLKQKANRRTVQAELAPTKSDNESKGRWTTGLEGDRLPKKAKNITLNFGTRSKGKTGKRHTEIRATYKK
jgi:hypothetical protein